MKQGSGMHCLRPQQYHSNGDFGGLLGHMPIDIYWIHSLPILTSRCYGALQTVVMNGQR